MKKNTTKKKRTKTAKKKVKKPTDLSHINDGLRSLAVGMKTLKHDPKNAREHSDRNLDLIEASLRQYGQVKPIVVRKSDNIIVAGNGTFLAALSLGWKQIACIFVDFDETTSTGYAIADNRSSELAEWNPEILKEHLDELSKADFDLDAVGFTNHELDEMIKQATDAVDSASSGGEAPSRKPRQVSQNPDDHKPVLEVVATFEDEPSQLEFLEELQKRGIECRAFNS